MLVLATVDASLVVSGFAATTTAILGLLMWLEKRTERQRDDAIEDGRLDLDRDQFDFERMMRTLDRQDKTIEDLSSTCARLESANQTLRADLDDCWAARRGDRRIIEDLERTIESMRRE